MRRSPITHTLCITDGACQNNGKPGSRGGWAAIVTTPDGAETVRSGGESPSTNNRMELTAAIEALRVVEKSSAVELVTDSRYLADAINKNWIDGWRRRGWKTASGGDVANRDLWEQLIAQIDRVGPLRITWVRGHNGHEANERADRLAQEAARRGPASRERR